MSDTFDLIISGGTVVDGTGAARRQADLGIANGDIVAIGSIQDFGDAQVIDADGLIVAPGFVDNHTHYDAQIFWDPYCTASGWHGVTSVVMANCGFGFAPMPKSLRERAMAMMVRTEQIPLDSMRVGVPWNWESFPEYMRALENTKKGVNVTSFVPLNAILMTVMGPEEAKTRQPTDAEITQMRAILRGAMAAGACGFSFSRMGGRNSHTDYDGTPMPGEFASDDLIYALADELGEFGRGFIQTLEARGDPTEDLNFLEGLAERCGRPVFYAPVVAFDSAPSIHEMVMDRLSAAADKGIPLYAQSVLNRTWMEFSFRDWNMYDFIPEWAKTLIGTDQEKLDKITDPDRRTILKARENYIDVDWTNGLGGPKYLRVSSVGKANELAGYVGKTIDQISEEEGRHPVDVFLDIGAISKLDAEFRTAPGNSVVAEKVAPIARHPQITPGASDGGAHSRFFCGGSFTTEVLSWLVRDEGVIDLETAHQQLSGRPAEICGLVNRGTLEIGKRADIVIYDLDRLASLPEGTYETVYDLPGGEFRKVQRASGYRWTLVNGQVTLRDGEPTGALSGEVLEIGVS
jgi:N-acyl-D-amino-acid deacylase